MSELKLRLLIAAGAAIIGAGGFALGAGYIGGASTQSRAGVEKIIREYVLTHPEILPEAMQNLQAKEATKQIAQFRDTIETPYGNAWEGAADGDVTLVEFFDYACGYCRTSVADVNRLLAEDKKLKVVYHDMPVLGEQSLVAARASLALAKSGNFLKYHKVIYGGGRPSDEGINAALTVAGANPVEIRAAGQGAEVEGQLTKIATVQRALNLTGTPSWIIGDRLIVGAVGYEELKSAIAEARKARS